MPTTDFTSFAQEIGRGIVRTVDWIREQAGELSDKGPAADAFDALRPAWVRLTYTGLRAAEKILDRFPIIENFALMAIEASPRLFSSPQTPSHESILAKILRNPGAEMNAAPGFRPMERFSSPGIPTIAPIEITHLPYCQSAALLQRQMRVTEQVRAVERPALRITCCMP